MCNDTRHTLARLLVKELVDKAAKAYPMGTLTGDDVAVTFDLRGTTAGRAGYYSREGRFKVQLHPILFAENFDDYMENTIPHEVAHVVVHAVCKANNRHRAQPHGREWQNVMHFFGCEPTRTHDYDVAACRVRTTQQYPYRCDCRDTIMLGTVRHKRIQQGTKRYHCRACGAILTPVVN